MGVAQYKVAEDHVFASLTGTSGTQSAAYVLFLKAACSKCISYLLRLAETLRHQIDRHRFLADGVEIALANPNTTTAVLAGLAAVVLPGIANSSWIN